MRSIKTFFLLVVFCVPFLVSAQERGIPVYSDYLTDNLYLLFPSMAGASVNGKIRLTARQQWLDVNDAPSLQTLDGSGRIGNHVGVGGILFNDSNGRFSQQGVYATFAYHILLSQRRFDLNQLSFGLSVGFLQEKLDESDLVGPGQPPDPAISGGQLKESYLNIDFGVSYFYRNFFINAAVKNIIPQKRDIFSSNLKKDSQRQYLGLAGFTISPASSPWAFEPSVLFRYRELTEQSNIDLNFKVYYNLDWGSVWGGISYRRSFDGAEFNKTGTGSIENEKLQYVSPFVGITIGRFMFAYTYTYQANSVVLTNSGFHQITLGYNLGKKEEKLYECDCPAVNN